MEQRLRGKCTVDNTQNYALKKLHLHKLPWLNDKLHCLHLALRDTHHKHIVRIPDLSAREVYNAELN